MKTLKEKEELETVEEQYQKVEKSTHTVSTKYGTFQVNVFEVKRDEYR